MRLNEAEEIYVGDLTSNGFTSDPVDLRFSRGAAITAALTVAASTAKTFVDADVDTDEDTIHKAAHGWATGRKVALTTTGVLPTGLSATNYWVIKTDADHFQLASSAQNAADGVAVDITDASGGGTHTLTPAALSTASIKLQWSRDGATWFDIANSSQNVTATGNLGWEYDGPGLYLQAVAVAAAGQVAVSLLGGIMRFRLP